MNQKKFGMLTSSVDSTQVANTVRGIVLSLSSTLLLLAPLANISLTAEQLTTLAGQLGLAAGATWTLYGLGLKLVAFVTKR